MLTDPSHAPALTPNPQTCKPRLLAPTALYTPVAVGLRSPQQLYLTPPDAPGQHQSHAIRHNTTYSFYTITSQATQLVPTTSRQET